MKSGTVTLVSQVFTLSQDFGTLQPFAILHVAGAVQLVGNVHVEGTLQLLAAVPQSQLPPQSTETQAAQEVMTLYPQTAPSVTVW